MPIWKGFPQRKRDGSDITEATLQVIIQIHPVKSIETVQPKEVNEK